MSSYSFSGKDVLVTGGAGFVGSNLSVQLAAQGARVTVVDSFHPDYGGNEFNLASLAGKPGFRLVRGDITDRGLMQKLCAEADAVFHVAAQCSHVDSMTDPWRDVDFNCVGTLSLLEGVKASARKPFVVYAGTRAIVGAPLQLPANESTLPNPVDIYGVNKLAGELYGSVYARVHGVPYVSLRLTNSYGPRHQMKSGKYGILNWFISLALQGKPIKVFGTGAQLRDYLYIDDAIEAFLAAGRFAAAMREGKQAPRAQLAGAKIPFAVFNIGSGAGMPFVEAARAVTRMAGSSLELVPWPADRAAIETGDYVSDGAVAAETLSWAPKTSFEAGLSKTVEFYRANLSRYL